LRSCQFSHFSDRTFLRHLADKQVPVIVATGMGEDLAALGVTQVVELEPWRSISMSGVVIGVAPAVRRGPTNTYVIQGGGRSIYFDAETVFFSGLSRLAERFAQIDVVFLPAAGLKLRWGPPLAMDSASAVEAISVLRPRVVIPVLDQK
jgi:L-ascorbate metabolism protein UlaG (beta-lactamase superfamily)